MGGLVLPLAHNGLSAEGEEALGLDEVPSDGAVRVLESHYEGRRNRRRKVGGGHPDPGRHLGDLQGSVGGVVFSELCMKHSGRGDPRLRVGGRAERNAVDKNLTPFDIGARRQAGRARQRKPRGDSGGEDVGGGEESVLRGVRPTENDQIALGSPPRGGDLHIGVNGLGGKHLRAQEGNEVSTHLRLNRQTGGTGSIGEGDDHAGPGGGSRRGRRSRGSRSRVRRLLRGRGWSGLSLTLATHHALTSQRPRFPPRGLRASLPCGSAGYSNRGAGFGNSRNRGNRRGRRGGHRAHGRQGGPRVLVFSHGFIDKFRGRGGSRSRGDPDREGSRRDLDDVPRGVVMANDRGKFHIVAEFSEGVVHVGPPIEAEAVGGNPGAGSDPGMGDGGGNKQEVEAASGIEGENAEEEVVDDCLVVAREVGAQFVDEGRDVKFTMVVH